MEPIVLEGKLDSTYDGTTIDNQLLAYLITQELWDAKKVRITMEVLE